MQTQTGPSWEDRRFLCARYLQTRLQEGSNSREHELTRARSEESTSGGEHEQRSKSDIAQVGEPPTGTSNDIG